MKKVIKLLSEYGFLLLVGAYFALTSIYTSFGVNRDVFWNTYIKSVRELFVVGLIIIILPKLKNTFSILFAFATIGISMYLTIFRLMSAYVSGGNYSVYYDYMKSDNSSLVFIMFIFTIFALVNYINKK